MAWERVRYGLDKVVVGCSDKDAAQLERLFEQLAQLFARVSLALGLNHGQRHFQFPDESGSRTSTNWTDC